MYTRPRVAFLNFNSLDVDFLKNCRLLLLNFLQSPCFQSFQQFFPINVQLSWTFWVQNTLACAWNQFARWTVIKHTYSLLDILRKHPNFQSYMVTTGNANGRPRHVNWIQQNCSWGDPRNIFARCAFFTGYHFPRACVVVKAQLCCALYYNSCRALRFHFISKTLFCNYYVMLC